MAAWVSQVDARLAAAFGAALLPLSVCLLASSLDDLVIDLLWLRRLIRRVPYNPPPEAAERRTAILIPLWHEHDVIAGMLEHNLAAIRYANYEIFVGAYPNDAATLSAVRELESRHRRVHLALVPHDGPTVKADCLNWIYQYILLYEELNQDRFESLVIHDAEDLIHPESLRLINRHLSRSDMVQVPVLPLATPLREWTHGLYCDDFAQSQARDLQTRVEFGGFLPGCGVGTGFRRAALERLAEADSNQIFHPSCLTEDYENGLRLHELGSRQEFLPLFRERGAPVATREFFPRTVRSAVRQRTRWVLGNALQTWQRHGWPGTLRQKYFLWRDRKGLFGNPLSLLCTGILLYGLLSLLASAVTGGPWRLSHQIHSVPGLMPLCWLNSLLLVERIAARSVTVARIYGWRFAAGVPLRMLWGNWINFRATERALFAFARALWLKEPLRWIKTQHAFPSRGALVSHKRRLGEILVGSEYLSQEALDAALATQRAGTRLGEHLMELGLLTEDELYEALSLQQNLPWEPVDPNHVSREVARALPARIVQQWKVFPFRVAANRLEVASPELPSDDMQRALERLTRLEIGYKLVTPSNFEELTRQHL
jgi:bacteriophage N4 adsorption protein B